METDQRQPPDSAVSRFKIRAGSLHAVRAFFFTVAGLRAAWRHEEAFRQEVFLFVVLFPLGVWLGDNGVERALLVGCLVLVLIVEIVNSALEAAVDRHGDEIHKLSGRAKDMGSAAVFLALCNVGLVWGLVLFS